MSSLVPILFLLGTLYAFQRALSPPNSVPTDEARVQTTKQRILSVNLDRVLPIVTKPAIVFHFVLEAYGQWVKSQVGTPSSSPLIVPFMGICPPVDAQSLHLPWVPLALVLFGSLYRLSAFHTLGSMYTFEMSLMKEHHLVTRGPYRFVRHPGYTGYIFLGSGYIMYFFSPGGVASECLLNPRNARTSHLLIAIVVKSFSLMYGFIMTLWFVDVIIFLVRRSYEEDELMKKQFGKEWIDWSRKVKWRVIPYIL